MKKIFKTISASLLTALIVLAAILTAVVLLEMFVVKLFPDVSLPIYRACCVAIFNVLFVIIFGLSIIKFASSRLSRFLNKIDDNKNSDSAVEYVKNELDETKKELERRLHERYLIDLRGLKNAMQTYKFETPSGVLPYFVIRTTVRTIILSAPPTTKVTAIACHTTISPPVSSIPPCRLKSCWSRKIRSIRN